MYLINKEEITRILQVALTEDQGNGDHTSLAIIPEGRGASATLVAKESGIIAGVEAAVYVLSLVDEDLEYELIVQDGEPITNNQRILTVSGKARSILLAERLLLNCMQRMSGIATITRLFVDQTLGLKAKILDTRKTTPGFRTFEKWAVRIGGGNNHRFGLFDMILIKDNHIDYAGSIEQAISSVKKYMQQHGIKIPVEIETRNLDEVRQVLNCDGIDRIMLDNFSVELLKKAVDLINGQIITEASGNINLGTVREYAKTGVDFISVGTITHSYKSLDLSLKAE